MTQIEPLSIKWENIEHVMEVPFNISKLSQEQPTNQPKLHQENVSDSSRRI